MSIEQIAALQPDLILSAEVRNGKDYEALSAIAPPTVFSQSTGPTWKDNIRLAARALGKEDLAEQKIADYEARAKAIGDEINATADNPTVSVVRFAGGKPPHGCTAPRRSAASSSRTRAWPAPPRARDRIRPTRAASWPRSAPS